MSSIADNKEERLEQFREVFDEARSDALRHVIGTFIQISKDLEENRPFESKKINPGNSPGSPQIS